MNDISNAPHPGKHLKTLLADLGISHYRFSLITGIPASALCVICAGKRSITASTAIRIAKALKMSPQFWLNAQNRFDLAEAQKENKSAIEKIEPIFADETKDTAKS